MSKLVLLLLISCVVGLLAEERGFVRKLKQRRLTANEIIKQRETLTKNGKLFQVGMPFDYIYDDIEVGTPARSFSVSVETGSHRLWLLDSTYPSINSWNTVYDPAQSATSVNENRDDTGYLNGNTISGPRFTDEISFFFQTFNQTFNTIQDIFDGRNPDASDPFLQISGVLGLAWDINEVHDNSSASLSPLLNICDHMGMPRIFSIWQERDVFPGGGYIAEALMSYGTTNPGSCVDDIQYFPAVNYDTQDISVEFDGVTGFKFGDYSKTGAWTGMFDTGASLIYVPSNILEKIQRVINPTIDFKLHLYTTDCSKSATLDDWVFTIGNRQYNVPATQYLVDIDLPNGQCVVAFDYYYEHADFIFGQPFLRQYCSIYDAENNRVGLSTAIHEHPTTTAGPITEATTTNV